MANFNKIVGFILDFEGGYVNDPDDAGGETYRGVSRVHNPDWEGWDTVDAHKPLADNEIINDLQLEELVKVFFYKKYWCAVLGDKINSQGVANMLADWQVHSGDNATKAIQSIVGVKADGDVGPLTLEAINKRPEAMLFAALKKARISFYENLCLRRPQNKKYLSGWKRRANAVPTS